MLSAVHFMSFDWLIYIWVPELKVPMHLGLNYRVLCAPYQFKRALLRCWSSRWPPNLYTSCPLGSKRRSQRYVWLHEPKASHSQRMLVEVSPSAPHRLHNGLSDSPIWWRCLLRVLCPVGRPVTTLDYVLLKDRNLPLAPRQVVSVTVIYEGCNFNSGNYLFTTDTKYIHV